VYKKACQLVLNQKKTIETAKEIHTNVENHAENLTKIDTNLKKHNQTLTEIQSNVENQEKNLRVQGYISKRQRIETLEGTIQDQNKTYIILM
jgi:ABC-type Zn2+ transport system substrate-binding protein/surface adhesin